MRHAAILGAIQGPAELLPVSSSGHLALVPKLLHWPYAELEPDIRKTVEVALHSGTAVALLIGLRKEVAEYLRNFGARNLVTLTVSFAPAAALAYRYERVIEQRLGEPLPIALALLAGSGAMAIADGRAQKRARSDAGALDALLIGAAQACALAPGVSRNGATLAAARWLEFKRRDANVISRQIALPVIVGAAGLKAHRLTRRNLPPGVGRGMALGACAAFASTLASLRLIALLERDRSLLPYALYRTALAGVVLVTRLSGRREPHAAVDRRPATAAQRLPAAVE